MFPSNSFEGIIEANGRSPLRNATPVIFLLTIAAIWFGASNSAREIVKEFPIYVRERLAFLFPSAYFLSKFLVLAVLCLVQCAILLIGIGLGMQWFDIDGAGFMKMSAVLLLASFAGLSIGLALSSVVRSSDQAISMTPVVLLPQIVFSGLFMPEDAGKIVEVLSKLHVSYWSFGALGQILEINDKVRDLARPVMGTNKCFDGALDVKVGSLVVLLVIMVAGALFVVNRRRTR
jgi:ABC-type multidrug transport system permease subunit